MKALTHTEVQEGAVRALKLAMKEGVAHETRQVGDDIQITTVIEKDVEGKVLAVSYPDGGIDYYPTEITRDERMKRVASEIHQLGESMSQSGNAEARSLQIQEALAEIEGDEDQAEIARLKLVIVELRNGMMDLLTHVEPLWNDRVKDGELELTVSAEDVENAIEALRKTRE